MCSKPMTLLGAAILSVVLAATASASVSPQRYGGTSYLSGGVGSDERAAMETFAPNYNVQLVFSQGREYLSDVDVQIRDRRGRTLLQAHSKGPLLFANLPPGEYLVIASSDGSRQEKLLKVGGAPVRVGLIWAQPAARYSSAVTNVTRRDGPRVRHYYESRRTESHEMPSAYYLDHSYDNELPIRSIDAENAATRAVELQREADFARFEADLARARAEAWRSE